jgi:hypothetical protein
MGKLREEIADTEHQALFDWWLEARGRRRMPARVDFDPLDHPRFLPRIFLVEISAEPPHFLNRLCGTEIDEQQGYPMTGRPFEEVFTGDLLSSTLARFSDVAFNGRISYHSTVFTRAEGDRHARFTRLLLPLSDDGERVDMILGSRIRAGKLKRSFAELSADPTVRERFEAVVATAAEADRADVTVLAA